MVFSIVLSRQPSPALLFFKLIEVETKFPFANSISEFSRSQDPERTSASYSRPTPDLTPDLLKCASLSCSMPGPESGGRQCDGAISSHSWAVRRWLGRSQHV